MISAGQLWAFGAVAFVMVVVPGPSVLFTIGRALTLGRRGALLTVIGNSAGVYAQVIAVAFGLGTLVAQSVTVFTIVKLLGAGYLIYLGVQALRHRRSLTAAVDSDILPRRTGSLGIVRDGFVVGLANPKSIVFLAAVLPQFVDYGVGSVPVQILLLGIAVPAIALFSDSGWALAAGTARRWFTRSPRRLELIGGAGGLTMMGLGITMLISGRRD